MKQHHSNIHNDNFTSGNLYKQIFFFSLPLILSNSLQVLFNLSDICIVGRFAGSTALGCVGCTANLVALFTGILVGVGSAVNVLVSKFIGMQKAKDVEETLHTSFFFCFLIGIAMLLFGLFMARPVLNAMNTKPEHLEGAVLYIQIYFLGMPALSLYNCASAVYSAAGNTKKPLFFLTLSGIANVILNLILVIICKLGVAGVAIASAFSLYLAAFLIIFSLVRDRTQIHLDIRKIKFYPGKTLPVVKLGLSSGFQYAIFQIANVFVQSGVNSFDTATVEGAAASANADNIVYEIMAAFYTACCTFISQNYGSQNRKRMIKSYLISMFYAFGIALILGILLIIFGREFLSIFTTNEAVISEGLIRLRIMAASYCISSFMDCTLAASRGLGATLVPNLIVIMGSCVFRLVWMYTVFAYFHTITSVYTLYACSWILTALGQIIYFILYFRRLKIQQ